MADDSGETAHVQPLPSPASALDSLWPRRMAVPGTRGGYFACGAQYVELMLGYKCLGGEPIWSLLL